MITTTLSVSKYQGVCFYQATHETKFHLKYQSDPFAKQLGLSMSTKVLICKKIEDELRIDPTDTSFCKYQLFNLMRDYFPIIDSKRLECVKRCFQKKKFYRIIKVLDFFEHTLTLRKCLVPCMLELANVYYINLMSIMLPSRCFLFNFFLLSSKL